MPAPFDPHRQPDSSAPADLPDFATVLRDCRVAAGLSQEALAELAGVTARSIRNIERGWVRRPRPETAALLGTALGLAGRRLDDFVAHAREQYWAQRKSPSDTGNVDRATPAGGTISSIPAQLPLDVRGFTGRLDEIAALDEIVAPEVRDAATVSVISGTPGVGKTALAVRWAHAATAHFPDGQLYVNLRGYDLDEPMPPGEALIGFLVALGVGRRDVPLAVPDRAALYRSRMHGRRALVLLDNAASAEQVRPLLPGGPACVTLVTSRESLAGLVALDGAHRMDLDLLSVEEAGHLLRTVIGPRVNAEPEAAEMLVRQCARLPLALRVAAELAAAQPARDLATLVAELRDEQQRLDMLAAGDDRRAAVRTVLSWSYRQLSAEVAAVFRAVGLHPGADVDDYAASALAGIDLHAAAGALRSLADAHLLRPATPTRYVMHDLLRAFSCSLTEESHARAARTRLFDYYLAGASTAMDTLYPAERERRPRVTTVATPLPPLADVDNARDWLDDEMPALVKVAEHAANHGWPDHTKRLAATLYRYLNGDRFIDALAIHGHARSAARRGGDRAAEAEALAGLGVTYWLLDNYEQAAAFLEEALAAYRVVGQPAGEARALNNLALVRQWTGDNDGAATCMEQALSLYRATDDAIGIAKTTSNLGGLYAWSGRPDDGHALILEALSVHQRLGDRSGEATDLNTLGMIDVRLGRHDRAGDRYRQALAIHRHMGHRAGEAHVLQNLGDLDNILGRHEAAYERHSAALRLFRRCGDQTGETGALIGLATCMHKTGRPADALGHHRAALEIAEKIGARREEAFCHDGLSQVYETLGDPVQAAEHARAALVLFEEFDPAKAAEVRTRLLATPQSAGDSEPQR